MSIKMCIFLIHRLRGAEDDLHTRRPTLVYQPMYTWVDLYLDFSLELDVS